MKKLIITALVGVNLALTAILAFHVTAEPALAQTQRGRSNYTLASVRRSDNRDVLFVLDNNTGMLFGVWADTSRRDAEFTYLGPRDVARDFAYGAGAERTQGGEQ